MAFKNQADCNSQLAKTSQFQSFLVAPLRLQTQICQHLHFVFTFNLGTIKWNRKAPPPPLQIKDEAGRTLKAATFRSSDLGVGVFVLVQIKYYELAVSFRFMLLLFFL